MTRAYLDHASTSPLRPEAAQAMSDWIASFAAEGGDPGRIHQEGMTVRAHIEQGRERVAEWAGCRPRSVIFTAGATESIAAASWGAGRRGPHSVLAAVEHSAVRRWAERGPHTVVGVDSTGRVDPDELLAAVRPDTGVVHLQWANHEVGTLQPVSEVAAGCRERGVLLHVDAAQAAPTAPPNFDSSGIDLMSISGHKLGGPPGVGALLVGRGLRLDPLIVGGDQERARRAGLENTPGVLGLAAACSVLSRTVSAEAEAAAGHRRRLVEWARLTEGVTLLGHPEHSVPHLICLLVDGVEPQGMILGLDQRGVAAHSGSACSSEDLAPSPVLEAMGLDAHHSLRLSVGWSTTAAQLDRAIDALDSTLGYLRGLGVRRQ